MIHLRPKHNGYDDRYYLSLRGRGDLGEGETLKLSLGESVMCGRSRHCDWSLKRAPAFLTRGREARVEIRDSLPWKSTSRRHCRLSYVSPDIVEVENLSPNGTLVDGHLVDRMLLTDCRYRSHGIRLGPSGVELSLDPGSLPLEEKEEGAESDGGSREEAGVA